MKRILLLVTLAIFLVGCSDKEPASAIDPVVVDAVIIDKSIYEDDYIEFVIKEIEYEEGTSRIAVQIKNKTDEDIEQYLNTLTINGNTYDLIDIYVDTTDDLKPNETLEQGYTVEESIKSIDKVTFNYKFYNDERTIDEWVDIQYKK